MWRRIWAILNCNDLKCQKVKNVGEVDFGFKEVAFFFNNSQHAPEVLPEKIEVVIKSFEVAE